LFLNVIKELCINCFGFAESIEWWMIANGGYFRRK